MVTSGEVGRRRSHFDRAEASGHSLEAVIREELELQEYEEVEWGGGVGVKSGENCAKVGRTLERRLGSV